MNKKSSLTVNILPSSSFTLSYDTQVLCLFFSHLRLLLISFAFSNSLGKLPKLSSDSAKKKDNKFVFWFNAMFFDIKLLLHELNLNSNYIDYLLDVFHCITQHDINNRLFSDKEQTKEVLTVSEKELVYTYQEINIPLIMTFDKTITYPRSRILIDAPLNTSLMSGLLATLSTQNYFSLWRELHFDPTFKIESTLRQKEIEERNKLNILFPEHPFDELWPFESKKDLAQNLKTVLIPI